MARLLGLVALTACLALLCQCPSVHGRVIVRRQADESATTAVPDSVEGQTVMPAVENSSTIVPVETEAGSKVATTPPRPNDRFEQFPADGLNSDGLLTAEDESEDDVTSSQAATGEEQSNDDGDTVPATTLAPSGEESVGKDSSGTVEEDAGSFSSLAMSDSESSSRFQQSEADESEDKEDSTEAARVTTTASPESVAVGEITPAPTAAPARANGSTEEGSETESLNSVSTSSEQRKSEAEPSGESSQTAESASEVRVDDDDDGGAEVATTTAVPPGASDAETLSPGKSDGADAESTDVVEQVDLSRYTSASNSSESGATLNGTAPILSDESANAEDTEVATEDPVQVTTVPSEDVPADDEVRVNESVEKNNTVQVERTQLESNTDEVVPNEVDRNQTQSAPSLATSTARAKKGKFLDQFNEETTEDNDINVPNGAAWALAGMRMVERKPSEASPTVTESTEAVRDDNENVVGNNTLKQLMDWAMIMQEADFANSSFVRSTVGSDEPSVSKDRRTYANKAPTVEETDVLSEENRLPAAVTQATLTRAGDVVTEAEDANVVDTTFVPSTEKPDGNGQELEDFKFEDRSTSTTTESANVVPTTTRRTYEVSENVDESELATRIRNTPEIRTSTTSTQRSDVSTTFGGFEDVPVTTYSPVAPILRRTESTTPPIPLTTMISRVPVTMSVRRPVTMQDPAAVTTTETPVRETTGPDVAGSSFTTTVAVRGPIGEEPQLREGTETKTLDQDSTESSEVNLNLLNRTEEKLMVATSTAPSVTTFVPNLSSATLTNNVELDDASAGEILVGQASVTTERSDLGQMTTDGGADDGGKVPIVVDDTNVRTGSALPTASTTGSGGMGQSNGISSEAFTTRRTIDRSMTTTELSEEESVTEEDYIELGNAGGGQVQGEQNQTDKSGQGVTRQADGTTEQSQGEPAVEEDNSVVVAVVASIVSVIVVLLLIAAFIVFRKRQNQVSYGQRCRPVGLDAYSLDNVSVYNSVRRKGNTARMSKRSYGNSAFEDPNFKTNPLTVAELANIIHNKTAIYDEFKEIPNVTARADEVPEGCEDKNRYANVVPLPETRVHLKRLNEDEKTEYINANFVKGPKDSANYYIACQAPMENTINDFWRMIWEQNSKVIIMATDLSENGVEKCAEYLPPSVVLDNSRTFGDFQLTLKNRENKEKYTISTVHMRHTPTNSLREIMHFWYQWPDTGVPIDESSIIGMLLEARTYLKLSPSELAEFATIAEENEDSNRSEQQHSPANGTDNSNASNNNNNNNNNATSNGTAGAGKEPASIVSNGGTNTMDKHKSLQRTQGPLTVHCSPGTGRTGTLVACDVALRLLEVPPRTVDLPQIVYYVRRGRASAVRTREQYELIYRVANVYATKLTGPTIET